MRETCHPLVPVDIQTTAPVIEDDMLFNENEGMLME